MSDASDELSRAFDFDDRDDDAAFAQQVLAAVRSASAPATSDVATDAARGELNAPDDASASAPRASAARLLEALEALSHDTGDSDSLPQSLRGAYCTIRTETNALVSRTCALVYKTDAM